MILGQHIYRTVPHIQPRQESPMPYRFPIKVGDRVALAPHTDLWMAGCRYGTVTSINEGLTGGRFYFTDLDTGRNVTLEESDLLGAVVQYVR